MSMAENLEFTTKQKGLSRKALDCYHPNMHCVCISQTFNRYPIFGSLLFPSALQNYLFRVKHEKF